MPGPPIEPADYLHEVYNAVLYDFFSIDVIGFTERYEVHGRTV